MLMLRIPFRTTFSCLKRHLVVFETWPIFRQGDVHDTNYGRFVPKTIHTQVGWFVPSGLDFSYPKFGRFVPIGWTFRIQCFFFFFFSFLIFCIWFGIFASKIVRFVQPVECWSIRTHFLFISHTRFGLFYMYLCTNVWFFSYLSPGNLRIQQRCQIQQRSMCAKRFPAILVYW